VVHLTGQTGSIAATWGCCSIGKPDLVVRAQYPISDFEGGQISANVKQQEASYEENVANYREQVLVAFQDVEDSLSALRYLSEQQEAEDGPSMHTKSARSHQRTLYHRPGSYFDVIQAQGLALSAEQLTVQIRGERVANTVRLIKAWAAVGAIR